MLQKTPLVNVRVKDCLGYLIAGLRRRRRSDGRLTVGWRERLPAKPTDRGILLTPSFQALIVTLAVNAVIACSLFLGRNWLKARIERGVQYRFDEKLERLRSELRNSEESFRKALQERKVEISTLRENVFSGASNRRAMLDRRRFDAAERIWKAVIALAPHRGVAQSMAVINLKAVTKYASGDPRIKSFFETITKAVPNTTNTDDFAASEQPFVTEPVWAYFSSYRTIVVYSFLQAKLLASGIDNPLSLLKDDNIKNLLKATIPHMEQFIDSNDPNAYYHLLDHIQKLLLAEIKKMLDGTDADRASIAHAAQIMEATKAVQERQEKQERELSAG